MRATIKENKEENFTSYLRQLINTRKLQIRTLKYYSFKRNMFMNLNVNKRRFSKRDKEQKISNK